jgi:23S rRNA A1618 N6-methylase RlmF
MYCNRAILSLFPDVHSQHSPDAHLCPYSAGEADMIKLVRMQDWMISENDKSISAYLRVKIR